MAGWTISSANKSMVTISQLLRTTRVRVRVQLGRGILRQCRDFGGVGAVGAVLKLLLMYCLTDWLGLHYMVSYTLSFVVVVGHNYLLNSAWTFRQRASATGFGRFILASCLSATGRAAIVFLLTEVIGVWYLVSTLISIIAGFALNFVMARRWVWLAEVRE